MLKPSVLTDIEELIVRFLGTLAHESTFTMEYIPADSVKFDKSTMCYLPDTQTCSKRKLRIHGEAKLKQMARYCALLNLLHQVVSDKAVLSMRDIYYRLSPLFSTYDSCLRNLKLVQGLLRAPIADIGIRPALQGFVQGNVTFSPIDDFNYEVRGIPDLCITKGRAYGSFKFVLVVEKETVFQHLQSLDPCQERGIQNNRDSMELGPKSKISFSEKYQCVVTTSKGFACRSIRSMLEIIRRSFPGIPMFYLGDGDPYGILIYLQYCFGSNSSALDCPFGTHLHYLGVRTSDLIDPSENVKRFPSLSFTRMMSAGLPLDLSDGSRTINSSQIIQPLTRSECRLLHSMILSGNHQEIWDLLSPLRIFQENDSDASESIINSSHPASQEDESDNTMETTLFESVLSETSTDFNESCKLDPAKLLEIENNFFSSGESSELTKRFSNDESLNHLHSLGANYALMSSFGKNVKWPTVYGTSKNARHHISSLGNHTVIDCEYEFFPEPDEVKDFDDRASRALRAMGLRISSFHAEHNYLSGFRSIFDSNLRKCPHSNFISEEEKVCPHPILTNTIDHSIACSGPCEIGHRAASLAIAVAELSVQAKHMVKCEIEALESICEGGLEKYIVAAIQRCHPKLIEKQSCSSNPCLVDPLMPLSGSSVMQI